MRHKAGIGFLVFFLSFSSCAAEQQSPDSDFYEGLRKRQEGAQSEAIACFEKALNADNPLITSAAAAELMSLHFAGAELSEATMDGIRQKAALSKTGSSWAAAIDAVDDNGEIDREKFLPLLLTGDSRSLNEAVLYALGKWRSSITAPIDDTTAIGESISEDMAINGRVAVSRSHYGEAMIFLRPLALGNSPELFFRYPDLLTDLGRAYQYAGVGREGIELFLKWEKTFDKTIIPEGSETLVRFRLLFFAARIARQRGEDSIELFEQALPLALKVSPEQADACIWYILDTSLAQGPAAVIRYLEKYISQWHDDAYFSDILDKLARELVYRRQWEDIANVCTILRNRPGMAAAQYAWIISRALEEGLFAPENAPTRLLAGPLAYRRAAYDAGNGAWYYRSLSAAALGEPFLVLPEAKPAPLEAAETSPTMQFLLGFFEHNAAEFAPRYIRPVENDLSDGELRRLAEALGAAGQYQESIRLVSLYTRRSGYRINRQDLELLYPRPFRELVERYAKEAGLEPSLLYGLIRTESAFDPAIVSRAGAIGLTQLMPATAHETAARIHRRGGPDYIRAGTAEDDGQDSAIDLYDPAVNIHIGAAYLAYLGERMEDPLLALLAYNGGMTRVRRWRRAANSASSLPSGSLPVDLFLETVEYPETRNYGRNVMGSAAMYKELYYSNNR
jgi:soluble lytic murein transglycosylase